jgi:hypothetical protein
MDPEFLKGEEQRRLARQPSEMYDVTAWSLPLQFGVRSVAATEESKGSFEAIAPGYAPKGKVIGDKAALAYLVPWGLSSSARFLASALQEGLRVATTDKSFTLGGRNYPSGTLIIKVAENPANLAATIAKLAAASGAEVFGTDTGWMDQGPNFGSRYVSYFPKTLNIALAWDRPTGAGSAGATRYLLERQFGYPVTAVRTAQLATGDLSQFQVIVLPDGGFGEGYESVLGANGTRRLRDWVQSGGTLVALGPGAVSYLSSPPASMLAISQENVARDGEAAPARGGGGTGGAAGGAAAPAAPASARTPGKIFATEKDFEKATLPDTELPDSLHGVLLRAKVNQDSWLTAGVPEIVNVLVTGRTIYTPIKADRGLNAAYFASADQIVSSGFMWEQNRKQLAFKPFAVVQRDGRGNVIGFTSDPNFRGYMDGLNMLFLNAVFRGPSHAGGGGGGGAEEEVR